MPAFNGTTAASDLHYGVVVDAIDREKRESSFHSSFSSSSSSSEELQPQQEADCDTTTTSPLLLLVDNSCSSGSRSGSDECERHNASIEAEHRKFQEEARQFRTMKHSLCCVKILLVSSLLPTLYMIVGLSGDVESSLFSSGSTGPMIAGLLMIGLIVSVYRVLSSSSTSNNVIINNKNKQLSLQMVLFILFLNFTTMFLYESVEWNDDGIDDDLLVLFALLNFVAAGSYYRRYYYGRVPTTSSDGETATTVSSTTIQSQLRQKELFFTYMGTIKSVANCVYSSTTSTSNNNPHHQMTTELREFYSDPPLEGFYSTSSGSNETPNSQLFLVFPTSESPKGWWIRGARKSTTKTAGGAIVQSIVLEGFVSPTYEAYWTEGTLDGKENTLYYGKFVPPQQQQQQLGQIMLFRGEWLSFKGKRCHRYELGLVCPADPSEHLGIPCTACGRSAGALFPGTCYTSNKRTCFYCQACVENDPSLIHNSSSSRSSYGEEGDEFVALQLPRVRLSKKCHCRETDEEDQHYDPPTSTSKDFHHDLEAGL